MDYKQFTDYYEFYKQLKKDFKSSALTGDLNYLLIPVTAFNFTEVDIEKFNQIYQMIVSHPTVSKIVRTKSGGISVKAENLHFPMYDLRELKSSVELTFVCLEGCFRFQVRGSFIIDEETANKPYFNWWKEFKKKCKEHDVDLEALAIDNGEEVKKTIESPKIEMYNELDKGMTFENVHHIDFNASHIAGMVKYHPELKEVFEDIYTLRKQPGKEHWKKALTNVWGKFQSNTSGIHYKWAHISRDGIHDTNDRLKDMTMKLLMNNNEILLYNTDGIWYTGDIYHDENEGKKMGQWKHDYTNCTFRMKSAGAYEFKYRDENGKECYKCVVRGKTKLDLVKPRSQWEWGDIFKAAADVQIKYQFVTGIGFVTSFEEMEEENE